MNKWLLLALICFVVILCTCSLQPVAGGSSQQGNGRIVGQVTLENGSPAKNTRIRIRPVDYVQTPPRFPTNNHFPDVITDSTGHFYISGINPNAYTIEANDLVTSAALVKTIVEEQDEFTDVGTFSLKPYANVTGVLYDTTRKTFDNFYVQVRGLEKLAQVADDGSFNMKDLPEGFFDFRIVVADSSVLPLKIINIETTSGTTASVVIPVAWLYSHRLHLNTTSSGANVISNITNFPVLIRLTERNFDFRLAKNDGSDIRFTKSDNSFLPYEIERWDSINRRAEIWVKVDTVQGNDSNQFVTMHWGNLEAINGSNSTIVFDTSEGFTGVWHLNETGTEIHDGTGNFHNGQNYGCTTENGIIGISKTFANGNYIKIPGLLNSSTNVTLSAWVVSDKSIGGQDIVSIGDAVLIRFDEIDSLGTSGFFQIDSMIDTSHVKISSGKYLAKTGWHYLSLTIDSKNQVQSLYIDGIQCASFNYTYAINYSGIGLDTYIGIHGNGKEYFNFVGQIDEVRVYSTAISSDYIKLCFMNQKESDALVKW